MTRTSLILSAVVPLSLFAATACSEDDPNAGGITTMPSSTVTAAPTASGPVPSTVGTPGVTPPTQMPMGTAAPVGTGGAAPVGTGGAAPLGMGGSASGGMGGSPADVVTVDSIAGIANDFGDSFKDSLILVPCKKVEKWDCLTTDGACPNADNTNIPFEKRGYVSTETFTLGGDPAKTYDISLSVNGIVEAMYYQNGTRRRGADYSNPNDPAGTDTLYIGGEAIVAKYNVYKISVFGADYDVANNGSPLQHFYLNSFPQESGLMSHQTLPVGYSFIIEGVAGGSVIEYLAQDSNCRAINNCGAGQDQQTCPAARMIPNEPAYSVPDTYLGAPLTNFNTVNGAAQPFHAQMLHITVTDVKESL